jgi:hypothetical protein
MCVVCHRWLGVAGGLLFLLWFVSGVAMMYVRMPALTDEERLAHAEPLSGQAVRVPPAEAAKTAGVGPEADVALTMVGGRPAYVFPGRLPAVVFADSGARLEVVSPIEAEAAARAYVRSAETPVIGLGTIATPDQWTLQLRQHLPLFKFGVEDGRGTEIYVSGRLGTVVLDTARRERLWAYVGSVAHWLYLPVLRRNGPLWTQVIIWSSALGCVLCLTGLIAGVWRLSPARRYTRRGGASLSPYSGWLAWHHYAGLLFGVVTFTWTFSGLLSMGPFAPLSDQSATGERRLAAGGPAASLDGVSAADVTRALSVVRAAIEPREMEWISFRGRGYWVARRSPSRHVLIDGRGEAAAFPRFPDADVEAAARAASPPEGAPRLTWMHGYDDYYYDRAGLDPLPVLRAEYADEVGTRAYFDPGSGRMVAAVGRRDRLNRWLYHGLHSLDFAWLYAERPLWDIVLIVLSAGGAIGAATSLVPAYRRVVRAVRR